MLIVDAHLDLAHNALRGRDLLRPAVEQKADEEGIPSVGFPDLLAGGVRLVCATIFCAPATPAEPGYRTPAEAHDAGWRQVRWYHDNVAAGHLRIIRSPSDLPEAQVERRRTDDRGWQGAPTSSIVPAALSAILLLESADPLRTPDDIAGWFEAGLRIVGLAWKRTRYAGGTGAPGPLTPEGVDLVRALDQFRIIQDTSHLADESFWQLLDLTPGAVMASHSNCRAIVPTDRHLSDEMIRALIGRGGVIGINLYDKFLLAPDEHGKRRATLHDVVRHVRHICDLAGSHHHVALGTDMDGGFGREQIPVEIRTSADLPRLAEALSQANFPDDAVRAVMGGNWLQYFRRSLPAE